MARFLPYISIDSDRDPPPALKVTHRNPMTAGTPPAKETLMFTDSLYPISSIRALALSAAIALAVTTPQTLLAAPEACTTLIPLTAGETWRDPGRGIAETVCFDLAVDAPGIVTLDLITTDEPRARLVFEGPRLRQTPTSLVATTASALRVRVESEDPSRPLPAFRLSTGFAIEAPKSETDSETELDPDPFAGCNAKSETDSETELDPDPFAGCNAKRSEPQSFYDLSNIPGSVRPHLATLCRRAAGGGDTTHRRPAGQDRARSRGGGRRR